MYQGHLDTLHTPADPFHLLAEQRDRTADEKHYIANLHGGATAFKMLLDGLPSDVDGRAKAVALTKLDEFVMWAQKAILK